MARSNPRDNKPTIFDGIFEFTRWGVEQRFNGLECFELSFYDAVFLVDYGPWKAGDKPYDLMFDPLYGNLIEGNHDEILVKSCHVRPVPFINTGDEP